MASHLRDLMKYRLLSGPRFVAEGLQYEAVLGSVAYAVADDTSDLDLVGFCIPLQEEVFPQLRGIIPGFDPEPKRFEQLQEHHIRNPAARGGKGQTYDLTIYSIVKFFRLCVDSNPNIVDCLFVPRRCVLFSTTIGERVREQRHDFLSRAAWPRFKGYAYQQLHKIRIKKPVGQRKEIVERFGYDVKFGYHIVRLLCEVEQILSEHDLDLERNRELLKAIRRGEWSLEKLEGWFADKERQLEEVHARSTLPDQPDAERLKRLLLQCLEEHYGSLDPKIVRPDELSAALREIRDVVERVGGRI